MRIGPIWGLCGSGTEEGGARACTSELKPDF